MRFLSPILFYAWAAPNTCLGLIFLAPLLLGKRGGISARIVSGVIEVHGGVARFFLRRCTLLAGGASAMTLGHVVLGLDQFHLDRTREHERVHVRQAERWGPAFVPAYLISSLFAWVRGGDPYRDNRFEREAFAVAR